MDLFDLDLSQFGTPGFTLSDRLDMTGHRSGRVDPHINTDILRADGSPLRYTGHRGDFRDLSHNQIDGMNGMQSGW